MMSGTCFSFVEVVAALSAATKTGLSLGTAFLSDDLAVPEPPPQVGSLAHVVGLVKREKAHHSTDFPIETGRFLTGRCAQYLGWRFFHRGGKTRLSVFPGKNNLLRRGILRWLDQLCASCEQRQPRP